MPNKHRSYGHTREEGDNGITTLAELSKYRQIRAVDKMMRASQFLNDRERDAVFHFAGSLHGQDSQPKVTPNHFGSNADFITASHNNAPGANIAITNVLQGVVACLSGISDRDKNMYHRLIIELGGTFQRELGADIHITHLIIPPEQVNTSAKYVFLQKKRSTEHADQVEKEWAVSVKVVAPSWLTACWNSRTHVSETNYEVSERPGED